MIFYFTGTGNSKWVAELLGTKLNEAIISINELIKSEVPFFEFELLPSERIGMVFPVYSWGLPAPVVTFIQRMKLKNAAGKKLFAVATCGDNAGLTNIILSKLLKNKGIVLSSCHTVQMPNCYILIPGFDVDSDEVARKKIAEAPRRIENIVQAIIEDRQNDQLYTLGPIPWIKSRLIYPAFINNTQYTKFFSTAECTHCGLCAKVCPMNNIILAKGIPEWSDKCVQCHACIHRCPSRAIEYGHVTQKKGRYIFSHYCPKNNLNCEY